jgi:hypothetical protein
VQRFLGNSNLSLDIAPNHVCLYLLNWILIQLALLSAFDKHQLINQSGIFIAERFLSFVKNLTLKNAAPLFSGVINLGVVQ